jgi:hypothetical protein
MAGRHASTRGACASQANASPRYASCEYTPLGAGRPGDYFGFARKAVGILAKEAR